MPLSKIRFNSSADLSKLQQDIAVVAFESSRADNRTAFNLPNAFIDQFEDATGIDTTSSTERSSDEFVGSYTLQQKSFKDLGVELYDVRGNQVVGSWQTPTDASTNWTNDSIGLNNSTSYNAWGLNYTLGLENDWQVLVFGKVATDGIVHDFTYPAISMVISEDTSKAVGSSPFAGSYRSDSYGNLTLSYWNTVMGSAAPANLTSFGGSSWTGNQGTISTDYATQSANGGYLVRTYLNTGSSTMGFKAVYSASAGTITYHFINGGNPETVRTDVTNITINNVPSSGRFYIAGGHAESSASSRYFSLSGRADLTEVRSFADTGLENASGNFTSVTQTASDTVSAMSIVLMYEDNVGTATLNTDIIAQVSANNGTDWTTVTLQAAPNLSGTTKVAKSASIPVTAGTQPKYKILLANQASGTKVTRIQGVSLLY